MYAGNSQSAGRNFEAGRMKAIAVYDAAEPTPINVDSAYASVFGIVPATGNVWFVGKLTKSDSGRKGLDYTLQYVY